MQTMQKLKYAGVTLLTSAGFVAADLNETFTNIGDTLKSFGILFDGLTAFVISIIPFLVILGAIGLVLGVIGALLMLIKGKIRLS